jgi:hypothetical protein
MRNRWWVLVVVCLLGLGGCGDGKESDMDQQERAEQRAVQTRAEVDDLVDRIGGTGVEVTEDGFEDCDPQDPDAGLLHNYGVRFTVGDDAIARLRGEVADALEADGWTVRRDEPGNGEVSVRFLKGEASMGAIVSTQTPNATAGGSGGCVS